MIVWICSVTASLRVQLYWDGAVTERKPYPSDLTDAQWALIEPVLTAWKAAHPGRNPADKGFVPQPKRWVVEQTYGILMFRRRLIRDYEHRPASSESRVYWAMTDVMCRRLTSATPSWRWT